MQFKIQNIKKSLSDIARTIGYISAYFQNSGEFSAIRKVGKGDYPRFHLYIKKFKNEEVEDRENTTNLVFNLHLDQKKSSYRGVTRHSGDYDGSAVEEEAARIKKLLSQNNDF